MDEEGSENEALSAIWLVEEGLYEQVCWGNLLALF